MAPSRSVSLSLLTTAMALAPLYICHLEIGRYVGRAVGICPTSHPVFSLVFKSSLSSQPSFATSIFTFVNC
ncbi:hypothetical protein F5882DRAFT_413559 [Hyaloscypha sp. PMI_1271]|nr:hypothetical protein F5882DRAFT_413559 [Hyaloscypha sp. PMI_1271]